MQFSFIIIIVFKLVLLVFGQIQLPILVTHVRWDVVPVSILVYHLVPFAVMTLLRFTINGLEQLFALPLSAPMASLYQQVFLIGVNHAALFALNVQILHKTVLPQLVLKTITSLITVV